MSHDPGQVWFRLEDDVADAMLDLADLALRGCVDNNDVPFRSGFPYLAPVQ